MLSYLKKYFNNWRVVFWSTLFVFMCICNILLIPVSDDLNYPGNGFEYAVYFYTHWAGRLGSMISALFVRHMNPFLFDIINAGIGTLLFYLLFLLIEGEKPSSRQDFGELSFIIIGVLLTTMFGAFFLWTSGAVDYLWGYVLILFHWIPFRLYWKNYDYYLSSGKCAVLIFLSLFAGWSSEQVGIMSILVHMGLILYGILKRNIRFPFWYWTSILAFVIGFCLLYFSPGLEARSKTASVDSYYYSFRELISMDLVSFLKRIWTTVGACTPHLTFLLFCCIVISLAVLKSKRKILIMSVLLICISLIVLIRFLFFPYIFWHLVTAMVFVFFVMSVLGILKNIRRIECWIYVVFFISLISLIQVGFIPDRSKFGESLLLITICVFLLKDYVPQVFRTVLLPTICIICSLGVVVAFYDFHKKQQLIEVTIYNQKESGKNEIVIPEKYFHSLYFGIGDFYGYPCNHPAPPEYWLIDGYCEYYNVKSITLE